MSWWLARLAILLAVVAALTHGAGRPAVASTSSGRSPSAIGACSARNLSVTKITSDGTAGTIYIEVVLSTVGHTRCSVYGYPAVTLYAKRSGTISRIAISDRHEPATGNDPMGTKPRRLLVGPGTDNPIAFSVGVVQVETDNLACMNADDLEYESPEPSRWSGPIALPGGTLYVCRPTMSVSAFERPPSAA